MIEYGGTIYYIDLDRYDEYVKKIQDPENKYVIDTHRKTYLDNKNEIISIELNEESTERIEEINAVKYDVIRKMIDVILDTENEEMDDSMGAERGLSKGPISFKIAFNTLYHYGILKEKL